MKVLKKNWRVFVFCFILVVAAELIGVRPIKLGPVGFTLLPMLYALVMGLLLYFGKLINKPMMEAASPYITISVMYLTAKMGSTIGPNIESLFTAGIPLIAQSIVKKFLFIPFAVALGVCVFKIGRAAVGGGFSTNREDAIAIVGNIYGLDSPEGQGVMGGYITGTLLGTIVTGLVASLFAGSGLFSYKALALGAGVGSASMMSAALGATVEAFPTHAEEIQALTAGTQVISGIYGMYVTLFICLPLANYTYKLLTRKSEKGK